MTSTARALLSRVTVIGLAASVALSIGLAARGAATGVEALLAGLTAGTATLVLDASVRAERRARQRRTVESADWLPGGLALLTGATRTIVDRYPDPEILGEARRRLHLLTMDFEQLAQGRIARPAGEYDLLLGATHACHRRLQAVAYLPDDDPAALGWWIGEPGRRYWAANLEALARGVAVTRVFLSTRVDDRLAEIISEQRAAGVLTLVAAPEAVDPAFRVNLVVWDGRRAWQGRTDRAGGLFTVNDQDTQRLVGVFAGCASAARPVDG